MATIAVKYTQSNSVCYAKDGQVIFRRQELGSMAWLDVVLTDIDNGTTHSPFLVRSLALGRGNSHASTAPDWLETKPITGGLGITLECFL